MAEASLDAIKQRLNSVDPYHPAEADTFSDWTLEAGDTVTMKRGADSYQSPVHTSRMVWKGAPQISLNSTGNKEREAIAKVSKKKYRGGGGSMRNQQGIFHDFYSDDGYLQSHLEMTESHLRTEFIDGYNSMRGELEMTASHLRTEFTDDVNSLRGEFEITASHLRTEFTDDVNSLRGEFEVTASHLRTEFEDGLNSLHGEFEVTASHLRTEFTDDVNSLRGEFEVTASHLRTEFEDGLNSLHGEFEVTASHLRTEFTDGYNSLRGEFEVTASHLRTEFEDGLNSLHGEFEVTASGLRSEFTDEVGSVRSSIVQQAGYIGMVVDTTDPSNPTIKAGEIAVEMNKEGSLVRINANRIKLSGNITLDDVLSIQNNVANFKKNVYFQQQVTIANSNDAALNLYRLNFVGSNTYSMTPPDVAKMVKTMSMNNTTGLVTVQLFDGSTFDFRHAASGGDYVTGSWSGGTLTVSATPTGDDSFVRTFKCGTVEWVDSKHADVNVTAVRTIGGYTVDEPDVFKVFVTTSDSYNAGWGGAFNSVDGHYPTAENVSNEYIQIPKPNSTVDGATQYMNYYVDVDNSYAYIRYAAASGNKVARKVNPAFGNGWTAAYNSVDGNYPTSESVSNSYIAVPKPNSTVSGAAQYMNYYVTADNSYAYIRYASSSGNKVARVSNPAYGNGWSAAYNSVDGHYPTSVSTSSSFSVPKPNSTVDGAVQYLNYYVNGDNDGVYVRYASTTGTKIAKANITYTGATTYYTSTATQTISKGRYLTGDQTIAAVSTENISEGNIKKGVTIKVGDSNNGGRIKNVTGTFTSDANAAAGDILSNKTAYVNGSKVTGTIGSLGATTYYTSTATQTISSGRYLSGNQSIAAVSTTNISAANIKSGVTIKVGDSGDAGRIKNVTGTFTSDANASSAQIRKNYTAYVNGTKITGAIEDKGAESFYTSTSTQIIYGGKYLTGNQTIYAVSTSNIDAANIKKGVVVKVGDSANAGRIKNVTGTFTFDANAGAGQILTGYTAYVNGEKITGTADWAQRYRDGYMAGWRAYWNDSHWTNSYYNSSTKKYEVWIPSPDVTWNGSAWVSAWDYSTGNNGWFSYGGSSSGGHNNGIEFTRGADASGGQGQVYYYTAAVSKNVTGNAAKFTFYY